jgi:deoxycytidine triphosphate deaminase
MGILNRDEIERRLKRGGLLRNARRKDDGRFDIEAASYDLTAGKAVWREPTLRGEKGSVETLIYKPNQPLTEQPTVCVQPGQMIFVITHEDVCMPTDLCGTVYSRNALAKAGILALNAGHIDPGYEGPIVIRLINLRAIPWTLTLGRSIFTIVFQTLDFE